MKKIYEGKEPYIFISYAHKDAEIVMPIVEGLQSRGFRVWYDKGIEVGRDWGDYIAEHIQYCQCFVPLISHNTLASSNCKREIGFANDENKNFVTIHLEACELPAGFRFQLNATQAMFFYKYNELSEFLDSFCAIANVLECKEDDDLSVDEEENDNEVGDNEEEAYYRDQWSALQEAAAAGDAGACLGLGRCYRIGMVVEQDYTQAFYWYRKSAELGDAVGQYGTGVFCLYGEGTPKNERQAARWLRKSANQGYSQAQFVLGRCYDYGWGVLKRYAYAVKWYYEASLSKHLEAEYQLGLHYEMGKGVVVNIEQAIYWYLKAVKDAAEKGETAEFVIDAQFRLGNIYSNQTGTQHNVNLAVHWYKRAALNGHLGAQQALDRINSNR